MGREGEIIKQGDSQNLEHPRLDVGVLNEQTLFALISNARLNNSDVLELNIEQLEGAFKIDPGIESKNPHNNKIIFRCSENISEQEKVRLQLYLKIYYGYSYSNVIIMNSQEEL